MSLGQNIKQIRTRWGLSQVKFGELLGVTNTQIRKYESNDNEPRLRALLILVELSGISFHDLYTSEIDMATIPRQPLEAYESKKGGLSLASDGQAEDQVKELQGDLINCLKENRELRMENNVLKAENVALREGVVGDVDVD